MINTDAIHSSNLLRNYDGDNFCVRDSSSETVSKSGNLPARLIDTYKKYKETKKNQIFLYMRHSTVERSYQLGDADILVREYQDTNGSTAPVVGCAWSEDSWVAKDHKPDNPLKNTHPEVERSFSVLPTEILVNNFRHAVPNSWADKLQSRLKDLYEASIDEFPEQAPIAPESLRGFIKFVSYFPNLRYPSIVLTPNGCIRARWKISDGEQLSVTFINHNDLSYVLFAPNPKHRGKILRNSGIATVDIFEQIMSPYRVTNLFTSPDQENAA